MIVTLLTSKEAFEDMIDVCAYSAATCTNPALPPFEEWRGAFNRKALYSAVRSGHFSVLEHCSLSFRIEGISRAASHQLVRHRLMAVSQQSLRYTSPFGADGAVHVPHAVKGSDTFRTCVKASFDAYDVLVDGGVAREDAREVLPMAVTSCMVVTLNLRELIHIVGLRSCHRASAEMRDMASQMAWAVADVCPVLSPLLGPKCELAGYCDEARGSCGHMPHRDTLVESSLVLFGR